MWPQRKNYDVQKISQQESRKKVSQLFHSAYQNEVISLDYSCIVSSPQMIQH